MVGIAKSTTTPEHKTLYYRVHQRISQPPKKPPGKRPNPTADQPHEQCSHPLPPCPEPNKANESSPRVPKPDRKTVVPNYNAKFGRERERERERERKRDIFSLFCNVIRPRDTVIRANCNPKRANFCNGRLRNVRNCNESGHMYRAM